MQTNLLSMTVTHLFRFILSIDEVNLVCIISFQRISIKLSCIELMLISLESFIITAKVPELNVETIKTTTGTITVAWTDDKYGIFSGPDISIKSTRDVIY